jgi:hypothetical protein
LSRHSCVSCSIAGSRRVPMASCRRPNPKTNWSRVRTSSSCSGGAARFASKRQIHTLPSMPGAGADGAAHIQPVPVAI